MLEKDTIITLDNDKEYNVLKTMSYNNKNYALISDFVAENHVVLVEQDEKGLLISLIENKKEEELIINKFLKSSLDDLREYQKNNNDDNN